MEKAYLTLERKYMRHRGNPGSPLYVTFLGHVAERTRMEGTGTHPTLIVDKIISARPGAGCGSSR